jgi:hypothetical protein
MDEQPKIQHRRPLIQRRRIQHEDKALVPPKGEEVADQTRPDRQHPDLGVGQEARQAPLDARRGRGAQATQRLRDSGQTRRSGPDDAQDEEGERLAPMAMQCRQHGPQLVGPLAPQPLWCVHTAKRSFPMTRLLRPLHGTWERFFLATPAFTSMFYKSVRERAEAGGSACVFGYSSGAILSLRAAAHGLAVSRLALYDPPPTGAKAGDLVPQLTKLIEAGRRGDAVELFQTEAVGIPAAIVAQMRTAPFRPALEQIAPTLVYESTILGPLPTDLLAAVRVPTLVLNGEQSHELVRQAAQAIADALPDGRYRTLNGQGHDIAPEVVAPILEEFFQG